MDWENDLIKHLQWSDTIINREAKEHVAREIAAIAKDGETVGAGSGLHRLPDAVRTGTADSRRTLAHRSYPRVQRNLNDLHSARHPSNHSLEQTSRLDFRRSGRSRPAAEPYKRSRRSHVQRETAHPEQPARHSSSSTPANGSTGWEANSLSPWKYFPIH